MSESHRTTAPNIKIVGQANFSQFREIRSGADVAAGAARRAAWQIFPDDVRGNGSGRTMTREMR
ncbi:MAG TPA: hypothetical protein DDY72_03575 [Verrucomicrobia bacterium]|nr:hypothetical protein [Verrucomicrobiota bacterium]